LNTISIGVLVGWFLYGIVYELLSKPLDPLLSRANVEMVFKDFKEPFYMQFQVAVITGLVFAVPCITGELWGFVSPGLTRKERKAFYIVVPMSLFFFFSGIATGYMILPNVVNFFGGFMPTDTKIYQDPMPFVIFVSKMILAFGVTFQLPIVLMFLSYIGVVNSRVLLAGWRYAIMVNVVLAAVITPTPDAFNMMLLATPLILLYFVGIVLVKFVERMKARQERQARDAAE